MSGRRSRNKGARIEREIVRALQGKGFGVQKLVATARRRDADESRRDRAAEKRDEFAPPNHSITSSAQASRMSDGQRFCNRCPPSRM
jgi:hypothetical protein